MHILLILTAGLAVVIGGIVVLRLPAFLALTLSAILVAWLTPQSAVFDALLSQSAARIDSATGQTATLRVGRTTFRDANLLLIAPRLQDEDSSDSFAWKALASAGNGTERLQLREQSSPVIPGDLVVTRDHAQRCEQRSRLHPVTRVTRAMGEYFGKLAIIIVCASVIGRCLLDSGAAERIVRTVLTAVGQRFAPAALTASSFMLGIPVFFDTVFYLMIPLAKALRLQTGTGYLLYVMAIVSGATMAHSLVPPTPGPLAVAELFQIPVSQMIAGGCLVGLVAAIAGLAWALLMNRLYTLQVPADDPQSRQQVGLDAPSSLPTFLPSVIPVVLPIVLISLPWIIPGGHPVVATLSNKNVALLLAAAAALMLYVRSARPSRDVMAAAMQSATASAGAILLITSAGGAFGRILFQTNVAGLLQELPDTSPVALVVTAFLITAGIRTAQGSATVAMMTSAGIFGPLVLAGQAPVAPLYVALAIGCGSKPVSWMNDSGFWIITRMSGMSETEGLRFVSPLMTVMGIAGLLAVIAGVLLFPMH